MDWKVAVLALSSFSVAHAADFIPDSGLGPSAATIELPPASGELTTNSGDHLTGQFVSIKCDGLVMRYAGRTFSVDLRKIASATSASDVRVSPGIAKDQVTGRITVAAGVVSVATRDLGKIRIPISAFRCDKPEGGGVAGRATVTKRRTATAARPTENSVVFDDPEGVPVPATARGNGNPAVTEAELAQIYGAGRAPTRVAQATDRPSNTGASTNAAPAAANTSTGTTTATSAAVSGSATTGVSDKAAPGTPKPGTPTPKEQQEETERNSLEFLRQEAVLVEPRKVEADFGLSYLHASQTFSNVRLVGITPTLRFGILKGLEGFVGAPLNWAQRQVSVFTTSDITTELSGVGDTRFGLKFNALNEVPGWPALVTAMTVSAPTGRTSYFDPTRGANTPQVVDIRNPGVPQIATGHWVVTPSLTALKSYDPLILFGTVSYSKWLPAKYFGTNVDPGDSWEFSSGMGFSVNERGTLAAQVFADFVNRWKFGGRPMSQTGVTPISLKLGYTHIVTATDLINPSIIFGLTRDANDAVLMLDWVHRF